MQASHCSRSNLGSAVRLEKRLNEIVAVPVHRKATGLQLSQCSRSKRDTLCMTYVALHQC